MGDWIIPSSSLDAVEKGKISYPSQEVNPSHPACSLVTILVPLVAIITYAALSSYFTCLQKKVMCHSPVLLPEGP
jgi:hypothetical protein